MEEPAAEFASSLKDLTTNSKPLITMLTMIAEESKEHAPKIVEAIEDYLKTVSSLFAVPEKEEVVLFQFHPEQYLVQVVFALAWQSPISLSGSIVLCFQP